jgi:hypothetical protein
MQRTSNKIHLECPTDQSKTDCGLVIWEAVRVTSNPGQVTCPDCVKESCPQQVSGSVVEYPLAA